MQPELPWNVAGIAPEAREAARASARREGLSVGEWLTRQILNELADTGAAAQECWTPASNGHQHRAETPSRSLDSADIVASPSRKENGRRDSHPRVDDRPNGLAPRIGQTERRPGDDSLAVSRTTSDLNGARREQTPALEQLNTNVATIGERLAHLEKLSASDTSKDAVRALHQGLARLAEQIAENANRSALQVAQLATSIESVAGKFAESRSEGIQSWRTLEDQVSALAANVRALDEARDTAGARTRELEGRLTAAEHSIGKIEAAQSSGINNDAEIRQHAAALTQLSESLEDTTRRFAASEAQLFGNLARLEDQLANIDAQYGQLATNGRLQTLDRSLADLAARVERSDRAGGSDAIQQELRNLTLRLDAAEKRHREAIAELGAAVKEASGRLDASEAMGSHLSAVPSFDLPPFADVRRESPQPATPTEPVHPWSERSDTISPNAMPPPFRAEAFAPDTAAVPGAAGVESFLAAARRSAQASSRAGREPSAPVFSWSSSTVPPDSKNSSRMRFVLLGGLGLLIIAAIAAGLALSQSASRPPSPPAPQTSATMRHMPRPDELPLPKPSRATDETGAPTVARSAPAQAPVRRTYTARKQSAPVQATIASAKPTTAAAQAPAARTPSTSPAQDRVATLATAGNAKAQELLGLEYLDGEGIQVNEAEAAKWLERAARQGEAVAAYRLGTLYERGHGVAADPVKASQWYAQAARAGNRKAMHNLAVAYAQGTGVQKDLTLAAQWFTRAANLGLADLEFNLGVLYERGMGVPQSLTDAYKWYAVAAAQGDGELRTRIGALASQIGADEKAAAEKAAADFHPASLDRAANSPPDPAMLLGG